jgi:hypothetical protein
MCILALVDEVDESGEDRHELRIALFGSYMNHE